MNSLACLLSAFCLLAAPPGDLDGGKEKPLQIPPPPQPTITLVSLQQEVILLRQQVNLLQVKTDAVAKDLTDLPKAYVPRQEHDARDARLNVQERVTRLEDEVAQEYGVHWALKVFVFLTGFGVGALVATMIHQRDAGKKATPSQATG